MIKRALLLLAPLLLAQTSAPPFQVEGGRGYWRLQDAVDAIGQGEGTILIADGSYRDCAVQEGSRITYRAERAGGVILDGGMCEDKATLVLKGRSAVVEGIIFQGQRSSDDNGAGIRLQDGPLTVVNAMFRNAQQGILSHDDQGSTLRIDQSTFSGLGTCEGGGGCAHGIYIKNYGKLIVTRSRFERGTGGHYLKSWAAQVEITDNSFDDTGGRGTNYMIDLPAGAVGLIARNSFVQGKNKENHSAMITVSPEAEEHPTRGLAIVDNEARLAPGVPWKTVFVADWRHEPLKIANNRLGAGIAIFEERN